MNAPGCAGLMVVTDLDGTLLDEETYSWEAAREALDQLSARAVPLVLATSKTQAEARAIVDALAIGAAAIVENGGAVVVPDGWLPRVPAGTRHDDDGVVIELGVARVDLVRHLRGIAAAVQVELRGFASLSVEDVADLTGLPRAAAARACERRFDEPFLVSDENSLPRVIEAARRRGLRVTRGGRFHHLTGADTDKGRALRSLLDLCASQGRTFTTIGLGDAANDAPFLEVVDRPVIVPRPGGVVDPSLAAALPHAERAPWPGPRGWNAVVLALLEGRALTPVAGDVS